MSISLEDLLRVIKEEPDREQLSMQMSARLDRIRNAFEAFDEDDYDGQFVTQYVDRVLEPALNFLYAEVPEITPPVRKAIGALAEPLVDSFMAIDDLADVRLRAQGRYYDLDENVITDPEDVDDSDLDEEE